MKPNFVPSKTILKFVDNTVNNSVQLMGKAPKELQKPLFKWHLKLLG